ncbi:peptidoglycan-binding domain-containing protein [Scytonema sp. PCC 10023]|uniref:peptidoglycan-binding domain-containing protein n=1 Tax=Scytonema sp. PCC 10023 TaxID=1680591 RepID=UPI0039C5BCDA
MSTQARPLLRSGSKGDAVKAVQERLNFLGYGPLVADGIFGSKTEAAVKLFQKDKGLTVDGIVGNFTWDTLFAFDNH